MLFSAMFDALYEFSWAISGLALCFAKSRAKHFFALFHAAYEGFLICLCAAAHSTTPKYTIGILS